MKIKVMRGKGSFFDTAIQQDAFFRSVGTRSRVLLEFKPNKKYKTLPLVFLIATLAGCFGSSPQYLTRPEAISVAGPYIHKPSGFSFPVTAGEFKRGPVYQYDVQGRNIGVAYNLVDESRTIAATVYIYPSPAIMSIGSPSSVVETARTHLCQQEFDVQNREIMAAHPNARLIDMSESSEGAIRHFSLFEYKEVFANVRQLLFSELELSCYVKGKWTVKYRITYPKTLDVVHEVKGIKRAIVQ